MEKAKRKKAAEQHFEIPDGSTMDEILTGVYIDGLDEGMSQMIRIMRYLGIINDGMAELMEQSKWSGALDGFERTQKTVEVTGKAEQAIRNL